MDFSLTTLIIILAVFTLAGFIKGIVGLGLPPIVLGVLTSLIGIHSAMALVALPALATNFTQAISGKYLQDLYRDYRSFFVAATLSVGLGCWMSLYIEKSGMSLLLGVLLCIYGLLGLSKLNLSIPHTMQTKAGLLLGACNGIFTGLTGSSAVPGVFYLQSVGMQKDELIQAMGVLFTCSSIGLTLGLAWNNILSIQVGMVSVVALIPAFAGMAIGAKLRQHISVPTFQKLLFGALCMLGLYIISKAS